MKLTKISLAAVVALGAFSTSSFAASLEESIKGVDVSGYVRYRFDSKNDDTGAPTKDGVNKFKAGIKFSSPVTDNVGVTVGATHGEEVVGTSSDREFTGKGAYNVDHIFVTVAPSTTKTTILAGKRAIGAPVTDDMKATGITVLNSDLANFTFAGVYLDNLMADGDATAVEFVRQNVRSDLNLYAVAAIANFAPVTAQAWYFNVPNVIDSLVFAEIAADVDAGGATIGVKGQYAMSTLDDSLKAAADDAFFWGIQLSGKMSIVGLKAGYTYQEADNGKLGLVSIEDTGALIVAGEQLPYSAQNNVAGFAGETSTFFIGASVSPLSDLTLAADYVASKNDIGTQEELAEMVGYIKYKYNKNWGLKAFYSSMDADKANIVTDFFRFEAKYSF